MMMISQISLMILSSMLLSVSAFVNNPRLVALSMPTRRTTTISGGLVLANNANDDDNSEEYVEIVENPQRRNFLINTGVVGILGITGATSWSLFSANAYTPSGFTRISPIQFIAALGDPKSNSGTNAQEWGLWTLDPGPRGVWLKSYEKEILNSPNMKAPAGWTFNPNDWWLEEHGLIMEAPKFPMKQGRYLVTGGRSVTTGLTINADGSWKLDDPKATLFDVTHLPCRSGRYTPATDGSSVVEGGGIAGTPKAANPRDFPVTPGAIMPSVPGCNKQDYAVLFVVGKAV